MLPSKRKKKRGGGVLRVALLFCWFPVFNFLTASSFLALSLPALCAWLNRSMSFCLSCGGVTSCLCVCDIGSSYLGLFSCSLLSMLGAVFFLTVLFLIVLLDLLVFPSSLLRFRFSCVPAWAATHLELISRQWYSPLPSAFQSCKCFPVWVSKVDLFP